MRTEIQLSPKAIEKINTILTEGNRVEVFFNGKTGELVIYRILPYKTEYRTVVANR